jgi:hypothetical protein
VGCGGVKTTTETAIENAIREGSGQSADVVMDGDAMKVTTDKGSVEIGTGNTPAEWPQDVIVYPGATVLTSANAQGETGTKASTMMMLETDDSVATVVERTKADLTAQGWTITATADVGGTSIISATKDGRETSMQIAPNAGKTSITMVTGTR